MILFSLITTILVSLMFFIKKSVSWAVSTFIIMMLFYVVVLYGVMPQVIFDNINLLNILLLGSLITLIITTKYFMDRYLVNEVGLDLADLIITIFPDKRLKLFVLFFVGQLAFSDFLLINILMIYFIGKILKIDTILIMIIGMISLIINNLFDASYMLSIQEFSLNSDYLLVNDFSKVFLIVVMLLAFVSLFVSILFIKDDQEDDFITIVKKDWKPYLIIIGSYVLLFTVITLFFDPNVSQTIVSVLMLVVISIVSTQLMKHNHEFMENENKVYPFIFSILIFILNAILLLLANDYIIVATLIFVTANYFILQKYDSFESENVLGINIDSAFIYKIAALGVFYYCFTSLLTFSDINNSEINVSIFENLVNSFIALNSPIEFFVYFFSLAPLAIFLPISEIFSFTTNVDYIVMSIYFVALFSSFNIVIFYILHDLLGVEDDQALVAYHAVMAFTIIVGLLLTIIVLIGG